MPVLFCWLSSELFENRAFNLWSIDHPTKPSPRFKFKISSSLQLFSIFIFSFYFIILIMHLTVGINFLKICRRSENGPLLFSPAFHILRQARVLVSTSLPPWTNCWTSWWRASSGRSTSPSCPFDGMRGPSWVRSYERRKGVLVDFCSPLLSSPFRATELCNDAAVRPRTPPKEPL